MIRQCRGKHDNKCDDKTTFWDTVLAPTQNSKENPSWKLLFRGNHRAEAFFWWPWLILFPNLSCYTVASSMSLVKVRGKIRTARYVKRRTMPLRKCINISVMNKGWRRYIISTSHGSKHQKSLKLWRMLVNVTRSDNELLPSKLFKPNVCW